MTPTKVVNKPKILVGYEVGTGEPATMEPMHTIVTGMTGKAGKTTLVEAIASRWPGQKFVVFIVKEAEEQFHNYPRIKPFYKQRDTSDWRFLRDLIEVSEERKLRKDEVSLLAQITPGTKTLQDVLHRIQAKITPLELRGKTDGYQYSLLYLLREYIKKLLSDIEGRAFATTLELNEGINVMDLVGLSRVMQAAVIGATLGEIHKHHRNVCPVIPEAWAFLPGGRGSPALEPAEFIVRQGRVKGNYLIIDTQDLAGVNGERIRANISNYFLGRQQYEHEVNRTRGALSMPEKEKPKADQIMSLGLGQFYAVLDDKVKLIYARPAWMSEEEAIGAAKGEAIGKIVSINEEDGSFAVKPHEDLDAYTDTDMYKQKAEQLLGEKAQLEERLAAAENRIKELLQTRDDQAVLIQEQTDEINRLKEKLEASSNLEKALCEFALPRIKEIVVDQLAAHVQQLPLKQDGDGNSNTDVQDITIVERRSNITIERIREPVKFNEDSVEGILCRMMKAGELDGWRTVPNIAKSIANSGGEYGEAVVRAAVEAFAKSPYHVLEQRKNPSSRAWEFRLNKEEAEQAFKQ